MQDWRRTRYQLDVLDASWSLLIRRFLKWLQVMNFVSLYDILSKLITTTSLNNEKWENCKSIPSFPIWKCRLCIIWKVPVLESWIWDNILICINGEFLLLFSIFSHLFQRPYMNYIFFQILEFIGQKRRLNV